MQRLRNSFWFSHAAKHSKAKVYYGGVYDLPASVGEFDIAVMGSVLLHCREPLRIIEQCGKKARSLIIIDMVHPDLEGAPICRLAPTPENFLWHTWWHFSTQFFAQFLAVMGFATTRTLRISRITAEWRILSSQSSAKKSKAHRVGARCCEIKSLRIALFSLGTLQRTTKT
jgi:hypothetical protein